MSWGTYYKHEGYLPHIGKHDIAFKRKDCQEINDLLWQEILGYMASTPPATAKNEEGIEYPWPEFIAMKVRRLREEIEDNVRLIARLDDCADAEDENPENVTEG